MRKLLCTFLMAAVYIAFAIVPASAIEVKKIEPMNWWVGMKTPLQLFLYGQDLENCKVEIKGLNITKIHKADSPNYLFVDVEIPAGTKPGTYTLVLTNGTQKKEIPYTLLSRKEASAQRQGFNSSDMIMLYMPDRFANGDTNNDNTPQTADQMNRTDDNARHGGDIQGVIDHLDYWEKLGVTAIWATPLLLDNEPRMSYHGYACSDYYQIDPRYGSNELFKKLVEQAHKHGIKVIMDVVTNHCGTAHWWMSDYPFKDWINPYNRNRGSMSVASDPNASQADKDAFHRSWFAPSMPDMNLANPFVVKYFSQWAIWWVEWSDLDSFRVDTYPYNDKEGGSQWCANVRAEYPNISIVGECWQGSPHMVAYWDGASNNYDGYSSNLTSVMDFPLYSAIVNAFRPPRQADNAQQGTPQNARPNRASGIDGVYNVLTQDFVYPNPNKLLLFAGNHDTNRIADDLNSDPQRVKQAMTMIATLRGIPQLYYGDEVLLKATKPRPGDGSKRVDFPGGWKEDTINLFVKENRTADQQDVHDYVAKLFTWRKGAPVIHTGKTVQFKPTDGVFTYFRYNDQSKVMVVVNSTNAPVSMDWERVQEMTKDITFGKNILTDKTIQKGDPFSIGAMESAVIEFKIN